jgi:hypothetical protein
MWRHFNHTSVILCLALIAATGCTTVKQTTTARTATEQLLISTAADRALQSTQNGMEVFAGRKVYVDSSYFDSYDSKYALGTIRDALSRAGARLEESTSNADIIVEVRSGALAINDSDTMFGVPSLGIPVPLAGTVQTPEIAFYKSEQQRSLAKIEFLALDRGSRDHLYSSGPLDGKSFDKKSRLLFVSWHRTDVPEKHSDPKEALKYQTWLPQDDMNRFHPADTNNATGGR